MHYKKDQTKISQLWRHNKLREQNKQTANGIMKLCMHVYLRKGQYAKGNHHLAVSGREGYGIYRSILRDSTWDPRRAEWTRTGPLARRSAKSGISFTKNRVLDSPKLENTLRSSSLYPLNFPHHFIILILISGITGNLLLRNPEISRRPVTLPYPSFPGTICHYFRPFLCPIPSHSFASFSKNWKCSSPLDIHTFVSVLGMGHGSI